MTRTTARGGQGTTPVLVLTWGAWVLVPLLLAGTAVASLVTFLGELPTPAEEVAPGCSWPRPGGGCQEHSGGDNRCPGG